MTWFPAGRRGFSFHTASRPLVVLNQPPTEQMLGLISLRQSSIRVKLTTHQHPLPTLRMCEATSMPGPYAFTMCIEENISFEVHVYLLFFIICRGDYQIFDFENIFLCEVGV
jgi:hypothetical protein